MEIDSPYNCMLKLNCIYDNLMKTAGGLSKKEMAKQLQPAISFLQSFFNLPDPALDPRDSQLDNPVNMAPEAACSETATMPEVTLSDSYVNVAQAAPSVPTTPREREYPHRTESTNASGKSSKAFRDLVIKRSTANVVLSDSQTKRIQVGRLDQSGQTQVFTHSGATVNDLCLQLRKISACEYIKNAVLQVGGNNLSKNDVDFSQFESLVTMVKKKFPHARVHIIPVSARHDVTPMVLQTWNSKLRKLCSDQSLNYIPVYVSVHNLDYDKIHWNHAGTAVVVKALKSHLKLTMPKTSNFHHTRLGSSYRTTYTNRINNAYRDSEVQILLAKCKALFDSISHLRNLTSCV